MFWPALSPPLGTICTSPHSPYGGPFPYDEWKPLSPNDLNLSKLKSSLSLKEGGTPCYHKLINIKTLVWTNQVQNPFPFSRCNNCYLQLNENFLYIW